MKNSPHLISLPGSNSFFLHRSRTLTHTLVHYSNQMVFYLALNGSGQITSKDRTYTIRPGDFLFLSRHTLYSITGLQGLLLYELQFLPHYFQVLCPELEDISFRHFCIRENTADARCNEIYRCLALFIDAWIQNVPALELTVRLSNLLLSVHRNFPDDSQPEKEQGNYIRERVTQIIAYIEKHYETKISIPQISRALGLNPQYFSAFFSRHFGIPFIDFLNQYRVDQSLYELLHSDRTITEIALNAGFQTYRTYQNAFQKFYHQSPSDYRSRHRIPDHSPVPETLDLSLFDFLQVYISDADAPVLRSNYQDIHLQLDLADAAVVTEDHRIHAVNIGSGYLLLQEGLYAQLQKASAECPFTHVHFRDIFSDLLSVYSEPAPGHPIFLWDALDEILQRIRRLHLYPFLELGYMPWELAQTKETLGFGYHPCIGVPRSIDLWEQMIRSFLEHCIQNYGLEDLENWRFGFWNTANICTAEGYWSGTREEFFRLYKATWRVFQEYSLTHLLGSPNFSLPEGMDWYEAFLAMCEEEKIRPGFLEVHLYSCPDNLGDFSGIFPNATSPYNYLSSTNNSIIRENLTRIRESLFRHSMGDLPILAGEWNITYHLLDLIRDTAFMATYVIHTWIQTLSMLQGLTFSCLSDISEQTHPSALPFPGSQGLITRNGLTKPAYHAFFLLNKLDGEIIWNDWPCLITRGKDRWHILLYHISEYEKAAEKKPAFLPEDYRYRAFDETQSLHVQGSFRLPAGQYQIITYRIDQEHGCAYDAWIRMGRPRQFTEEIITSLLHASYPALHVEQREVQETLSLHTELLPHTVILYEILRKR